MAKSQLQSARDYFDEVVTPAFDNFFAGPSKFSTVHPLATSLYHFHEWVWYYYEPALKTMYRISKKSQLWHNVVEVQVKDAGYIRDLNNASKHVELIIGQGARPSTPMHHSANTVISVSGYGQRGYGVRSYGGRTTTKLQSGKKLLSLDPIAKRIYKFWKKTLDAVDPPPKKPRVKRPKPPVLVVTGTPAPSANS